MQIDEHQIAALAEQQGLNVEALRGLLIELRTLSGTDSFYIFRTQGSGGGAGGDQRKRTLIAFSTADAALVFAQRNRLTRAPVTPRLRRLSLLLILQAVLREPSIHALLLAGDPEGALPEPGRLPHGVRVERGDLLRRLGI